MLTKQQRELIIKLKQDGKRQQQISGNKYLISENEHFQGYSDLILKNFNIYVVKEWECHTLSV